MNPSLLPIQEKKLSSSLLLTVKHQMSFMSCTVRRTPSLILVKHQKLQKKDLWATWTPSYKSAIQTQTHQWVNTSDCRATVTQTFKWHHLKKLKQGIHLLEKPEKPTSLTSINSLKRASTEKIHLSLFVFFVLFFIANCWIANKFLKEDKVFHRPEMVYIFEKYKYHHN